MEQPHLVSGLREAGAALLRGHGDPQHGYRRPHDVRVHTVECHGAHLVVDVKRLQLQPGPLATTYAHSTFQPRLAEVGWEKNTRTTLYYFILRVLLCQHTRRYA
eukprot:516924-Pyramimonas_sp.AAC.2